MANFLGLPKPLREQIYRLHLVREDPIDLQDFEASCGGDQVFRQYGSRGMPRLLQVCKKTEREAAGIYFGENTFKLRYPYESRIWKARLWPRHHKFVRKIIVDGWVDPEQYGKGYNDEFRTIGSFKGLNTISVRVDERKALQKRLNHHPTIKWHKSLGLSPSATAPNTSLLRSSGPATAHECSPHRVSTIEP